MKQKQFQENSDVDQPPPDKGNPATIPDTRTLSMKRVSRKGTCCPRTRLCSLCVFQLRIKISPDRIRAVSLSTSPPLLRTRSSCLHQSRVQRPGVRTSLDPSIFDSYDSCTTGIGYCSSETTFFFKGHSFLQLRLSPHPLALEAKHPSILLVLPANFQLR